jgi:hypothetical protein
MFLLLLMMMDNSTSTKWKTRHSRLALTLYGVTSRACPVVFHACRSHALFRATNVRIHGASPWHLYPAVRVCSEKRNDPRGKPVAFHKAFV